MTGDDDPDALAGALLQSALMDEAGDYLQRGRRFEGVATAQLNEQWTAAFRQFVRVAAGFEAGSRTGRYDTRDLDDAAAELRLRGLDLPLDAVKDEAGALQRLVQAIGPDAPSPSLDQKIEQFLAERRKPKN